MVPVLIDSANVTTLTDTAGETGIALGLDIARLADGAAVLVLVGVDRAGSARRTPGRGGKGADGANQARFLCLVGLVGTAGAERARVSDRAVREGTTGTLVTLGSALGRHEAATGTRLTHGAGAVQEPVEALPTVSAGHGAARGGVAVDVDDIGVVAAIGRAAIIDCGVQVGSLAKRAVLADRLPQRGVELPFWAIQTLRVPLDTVAELACGALQARVLPESAGVEAGLTDEAELAAINGLVVARAAEVTAALPLLGLLLSQAAKLAFRRIL